MRKTLLLLVAVFLGLPAVAGQLAGVTLPDQVSVRGQTLVLNGLGLREATVLMVNVYVAGLYVEIKSSDPDVILKADRTKQLDATFPQRL